MTWETIITVIVTLVGLIAAIAGPLIKLNITITKLTGSVDRLAEITRSQEADLKDVKNRVDNHEIRIHDLEGKHYEAKR